MRGVIGMLVLAGLTGTAAAGPVLRAGAIGGYDTSAPGHYDDGVTAGLGYRLGGLTAELDYAYFDYDGTAGFGGSASHAGVVLQQQIFSAHCRFDHVCPHLDLDAGVGERWVEWDPEQVGLFPVGDPPIERQGREWMLGVSATFFLHFALHYVVFEPDQAPPVACRGSCPMQVAGNDVGVLFEASFVLGGS